MATLAFHHISSARRLNLTVLIATSVALIGILFSISSISGQIRVDGANQLIVLAFLGIHALTLSAFQRLNRKGIITNIIFCVAIIEGLVLSFPALNDRSAIPIDAFEKRQLYNDYSVEAINYIKSQDQGFYRIEKLFGSFLASGLNDSQAQGYYDTKTYRSHNHNNYIEFLKGLKLLDPREEGNTRWIGGLRTGDDIHPLITMKYLLSKAGLPDQPSSSYYDNLGELNGINIFQSKYFLPLGIPFNKYIVQSKLSSDIDYFRTVEAMFNGVIVNQDQVNDLTGMAEYPAQRISGYLSQSRFHNTLKDKCMNITSFTQSHIKGTIQILEPSVVYFSIPFDAGWSASANGSSVDLIKINFGMTGMYLEPGQYQISLKYRPPFFLLGCILFIIGMIGMVYLTYKSRNVREDNLLPLTTPFEQSTVEEVQPVVTEKVVLKKRKGKKSRKK